MNRDEEKNSISSLSFNACCLPFGTNGAARPSDFQWYGLQSEAVKNKEEPTMANLITGLFDTESAAENAVSQVKALGYGQNEISIVMKNRGEAQEFAQHTGSHTMEGIGTGAAIGGTVGAVLGGVLAVGSIALPGVGLIAAGAFASMLAGAGAGGIAGSPMGWLVSAGIPEEVAPYYERGLSEGGVVVAVAAHSGDESRVQQVLQGGSVAYSNPNQGYVASQFADRHTDMTPPVRTYDATGHSMSANYGTTQQSIGYDTAATNAYDTATNSPEARHTANSIGAEQRSDTRTADARERAAHQEANEA